MLKKCDELLDDKSSSHVFSRMKAVFLGYNKFEILTLLHPKQPKLHRVLAVLSAIGLMSNNDKFSFEQLVVVVGRSKYVDLKRKFIGDF